ncbi:protease inhibitor I42 family protein [Streptomyces antimicrobicus]|uniref:Protease inhibitor I42 family protein n=1 Tax=Streptomyces antimicrobicus TaxID=2883108 RepID=A0ABS8BBT5_9ACTN|nr:protease inhibitor I42 family protein [Streptomyces antimicrobicus]MCB5181996.1 protease inhibitor I42 family protein [Streptomyces antimicrobicus]
MTSRIRPLSAAVVSATAMVVATALPAHADTYELTNADDGTIKAVVVGDRIKVTLTADSGTGQRYLWSTITASNVLTLERVESRQTPEGGSTATFEAVGPGPSDITAFETCTATLPAVCPFVSKTWKVVINVE